MDGSPQHPIDYRFAGGDSDRVRALARELIASAPDVIVGQSTPVVAALKLATSTIPIVFVVVMSQWARESSKV